MASDTYAALFNLMASRVAGIVTSELYAPGDFMYTNAEHALALDFALLQMQLKARPSKTNGLSAQFDYLLEQTLASGMREHGVELSAANILAIVYDLEERYFYDEHWMQRLLPDFISVITGQHTSPPSNRFQSALRSDLVLLLTYDLQRLHWALVGLFGKSHEIAEMMVDRMRASNNAQIAALFQHRYGCVSLADIGIAPSEETVLKIKWYMLPVKRLFDLVVTLTLCLLLSPLLIVLVVILAFEDVPIFYSQQRIGRNGHIFHCQKFSTMVPNAEKLLAELLASNTEVNAEWQKYEKLRNDPRITKLGRLLRRTSLDELPQLFNVIRGDMSLVGPRPMAVHERERWGGLYRSYTALRPGVTGPWQTQHRTDSDYESRLRCLEEYVANWSLLGDIKYLMMTLLVPFSGRGAY
jgi:exopolysaccharide production protein ExoY